MLGYVEVLWVVQVLVEPILDSIDDTGLQVDKERARDIVLIISLVEENILSVISLGRIFLQVTLGVDSVLLTQTLPEFVSN
jgi:hypothetical protein